MGLGAGFKLKDKDRDKSKEKEIPERNPSTQGSDVAEKDKDDAEDEKRRPRSRHLSVRHLSQRHSHEEPSEMYRSSSQDHANQPHHPYGWTSTLEDWYTHGGSGTVQTPSDGRAVTGYLDGSDIASSAKAKSTGDLNSRINTHQKGPYEFLVKERMMGIYLAVFIHRDIRSLVRGMCIFHVAAGTFTFLCQGPRGPQ